MTCSDTETTECQTSVTGWEFNKLIIKLFWFRTDITNTLLAVTQCHLTVTLKAYLRLMWSSGSTGAMT